ncbi:GNAT family N-acetyltransferase [Nocardia mexicana]|uniref:Ribosomal protein S18 acetylase RimI-like enzyme n=1 Tax=Nocardia mexicana TaxID=279262 RepID=A0A370H1N8_9NOCA|nr:GNAT family N-acetyltransferase [Nocardia mexicana]RDI49584.1 ribosomal protein S18 acetylase RimI-like enzyme [Nocardia mexicana]
MIRPATEDELPILRDIERAAGKPFAEIGMTSVAEDEPPPTEHLRAFARADRAWVYADASDTPIAYLIAEPVDGCAHIEQISVHPDHAGRGIGRQLIEHLAAWAVTRDLPALTLTTFTEVPWNGPYYERLGFHYLEPSEETPGLRALRTAEAAHGLDQWPRACMRRNLPG